MNSNLSEKKINKFFTIKKTSALSAEKKLNKSLNKKPLNNTAKSGTISGIISIMPL
jgi:hypothetical protein